MRQELSNLFHISIVCLIICRPVLSGINQFCDKQSSVNQCSFAALDFWINSKDNLPISEEESGTGEGKFEMAVVLYNEESILPLHKSQRTFNFVSRDIQIKQNWAELGVAAVVWDAAIVLCEYLESNPSVVQGKDVLELGAGTGLVGMVSGLLGGKTTITDRAEVLNFLEQTVNENIGLQDAVSVTVTTLDWTQELEEFGKFDVILGADIVYIEEVFDDLLRTLLHLSRKDAVVYLSCRIRYDRDTNFLSKMENAFFLEEIFYDSKTDVKLFKAHKR